MVSNITQKLEQKKIATTFHISPVQHEVKATTDSFSKVKQATVENRNHTPRETPREKHLLVIMLRINLDARSAHIEENAAIYNQIH